MSASGASIGPAELSIWVDSGRLVPASTRPLVCLPSSKSGSQLTARSCHERYPYRSHARAAGLVLKAAQAQLPAQNPPLPVCCFRRLLCSFRSAVFNNLDHLQQAHRGIEPLLAIFRRPISIRQRRGRVGAEDDRVTFGPGEDRIAFCLPVGLSGLIPTRLKTDTRPVAGSDRSYTGGICDEPVPGRFAGVHDIVVAVPDHCAEFVLT